MTFPTAQLRWLFSGWDDLVLAQELETKLGIQWSWQGDNIRFSANSGKAKGVSGTLSVTTSKVRIELDLPFLLRAMKGVVKGKITERLDEMVA